MLPFSINAADDGVIRIVQRGVWTLAIAEQFTTYARRQIEAVRQRGLIPRLLIDMRDFPVPAGEISDHLRKFDEQIRQEEDRVAMVMASSLLKSQIRRQLVRPGVELFLSPEAATQWLLA